jgi:hypothetical protein
MTTEDNNVPEVVESPALWSPTFSDILALDHVTPLLDAQMSTNKKLEELEHAFDQFKKNHEAIVSQLNQSLETAGRQISQFCEISANRMNCYNDKISEQLQYVSCT